MDFEIKPFETETLNSLPEVEEIIHDTFHTKSIIYMIGIATTLLLIFYQTKRIRSSYNRKEHSKESKTT
jgi:hypothetical protein